MKEMQTCPRCSYRSYEVLRNHSYCCSCNYSPDFVDYTQELSIPDWVYKKIEKFSRKVIQKQLQMVLGGAA